QGVNRANVVLKYVPTVAMDTARRSQILGEAKFLRALYYFNLARAYGGVPLRLAPSESGALTRRNWAAALAAANSVTGASLATTFNSLYPAENKSTESLFEVQFAGNLDGGNLFADEILPSPIATYS
nr:hypothetical protein [Tanacetum cinerariifolium]